MISIFWPKDHRSSLSMLPTWKIVSYLTRVSRLNDKCKSGLNQVELTNAKYGHMQECGCTVLHQFMFCECLKEIREYKVQSGLEASYLVRGLIFSRSHHPAGRLNAARSLPPPHTRQGHATKVKRNKRLRLEGAGGEREGELLVACDERIYSYIKRRLMSERTLRTHEMIRSHSLYVPVCQAEVKVSIISGQILAKSCRTCDETWIFEACAGIGRAIGQK